MLIFNFEHNSDASDLSEAKSGVVDSGVDESCSLDLKYFHTGLGKYIYKQNNLFDGASLFMKTVERVSN